MKVTVTAFKGAHPVVEILVEQGINETDFICIPAGLAVRLGEVVSEYGRRALEGVMTDGPEGAWSIAI